MSEYLDYLGDVEDAKDKINDLAFKMYQQGRADGAREFAELLKKKFNKFIDYDDNGEQTFESNPDLVWGTIDEELAEWKKGQRMTEKIKNAMQMLVNATYSDEWQGNEELTKAQHLAINSLSAWEEVLNELEEKKIEFANLGMYVCNNALDYAIDIINQHLAEIEEVR